jgi:DNA-binding MarR family transcriptional regulator
LNSSTRQVKASLSQLVSAGTIRHVQEDRIGRYWVPTKEERREFEQGRRERRRSLGHMLEGYDSELRRIQSLCMLVRRS